MHNNLGNEESDSSSDDDSVCSLDEKDCSSRQDNASSKREKRGTLWCGQPHPIRRVVWPPPSTSAAFRSGYMDPTHWSLQGPNFSSKMQLFSRTGFFLAVYPNGKVRGTQDENDPHTRLEIMAGGNLPEHIRIRGLLTNLYVAMDKKGRLYAESDPTNTSTIFIELIHGSYNSYLSRNYAHLGWYLGLKKSGKFKKGPKTKNGQKAVRFLPRRNQYE